MRLSADEYKALSARGRRSKYNNKRDEYYDPITRKPMKFDSQKEYEYYLILADRAKRGEIACLELQKVFTIQPAFVDKTGVKHRAITYRADFVYKENQANGPWHVVDCKGARTEVYKIKKKLLAYKGIIIEEV